MTHHQLAEKLGCLIRQERKITHEILELINSCLERRTFLELGFSSMFDWLTKNSYPSTKSKAKDKVQKPIKSASATRRVTKAGTRVLVIREANAECTFKDPKTGKVCGSRFQVQVDHITPKALGGDDEAKNLRLLCRQHNLLMAEKALGKTLMQRYWQDPRSS